MFGALVLLWNRSFIGLWVGPEHYAGLLVDLLIVAITVQTVFIRTDAYVIDATLRPRQRVLVSALAAVLSIGLSVLLTRLFGMHVAILPMIATTLIVVHLLLVQVHGPRHPDVGLAAYNLAQAMREVSDGEYARPLLERAVDIWTAGGSATGPELARAHFALALPDDPALLGRLTTALAVQADPPISLARAGAVIAFESATGEMMLRSRVLQALEVAAGPDWQAVARSVD